MLAPIFATLLALSPEPQTVSLSNGADVRLGTHNVRYWGCADTFLNSETADTNYGGSHILEGGPRKLILIKFGDLDRFVGGKRKVLKATLFLTPSSDIRGRLRGVKRVTTAWGEGPETSPFAVPNPLSKAPALSATWNSRRSAEPPIKWQQPGASGSGDSQTITDAALQDTGGEVEIRGLAGTVQQMLDSDFQNRGFAIEFSGPVEFFSSENRTGRPRLELQLGDSPESKEADLSVVGIDMDFSGKEFVDKPWPKEGEEVTYTVHIKNVGNSIAQGFTGSWNVGERQRSTFEIKRGLPPGEEFTTATQAVFKSSSGDHRVNPVGFLLIPAGLDATKSNDSLQIYPNAVPVDVALSEADIAALNKATNFRGSKSAEDTVQGYITILNDIVLPKSRFSFAPDGALERFRLRNIKVAQGSSDLAQLAAGTSNSIWVQALKQAGLITYEKMNSTAAADTVPSRLNGLDRYPGILGGGSTLDEIGIPGDIQLPYEPFSSPIFNLMPLEGTGLLAASDVSALNANLGTPLGGAKTLGKLPSTVLIRALSLADKPLGDTTLTFYQSAGGVVSEAPAFTVKTSVDGVALLPSRDSGDGKRDVFGGLQNDGGNGVYRIKAETHGTSDVTWLKAWQLSDSYSRTGHEAAICELRFNLPSEEVDRSVNLAKNRIITDSADDLPAKLTGLVNDDLAKEIALPNTPDAWVEIDLGRDRPVAEINLVGTSPEIWSRFDVVSYSTGTTVKSALPWFQTLQPEFVPNGDGTSSLPIRGIARLMRYVRFICREPGTAAHLAEIQIFPAKPPAP